MATPTSAKKKSSGPAAVPHLTVAERVGTWQGGAGRGAAL